MHNFCIELHTTDSELWPFTVHVGDTLTVKSDSSIVAAIGGAMGGTILFVIITVLLIIMLWCVWLSHKKKAYHIDDSSLELESKAITEKFKENNDDITYNTATIQQKGRQMKTDSYIPNLANKSLPHHNATLETTIKMDVDSLTGNVNPCNHDYDFVLDHSIEHPKLNSTPTQYLSLYHTDSDATIRMDSNPSYGLAMQNTNTSNAVVVNEYDFIDDGSIDNPLHHETVSSNHRKSPLLTTKKGMRSAQMVGQNPITTKLQYYSVTTEPSVDVDNTEYGVVNQPKSDTFGEPTRKLSEDTYVPVYGVVNQPKSDDLFSSSPPSDTKYGVVNQPMSDDPIIDEITM